MDDLIFTENKRHATKTNKWVHKLRGHPAGKSIILLSEIVKLRGSVMIKEKYYVKKWLKFIEVLGQNLVLLTNLRLEHLLLVFVFFLKEASIISSTNQT